MASVGRVSLGRTYSEADRMRTWTQTPRTCPRSAVETRTHTHDAHEWNHAQMALPSGTWRPARTFVTRSRTSPVLFWTLCTHSTNRKWCQSLSPGRQRRLLRYRDSGFLFLSFSSAPLSHGLAQIDTGPSVAGVHPSLNQWPGPSKPGLASLCLPRARSVCRYLTVEQLTLLRFLSIFY